MNLPKYQRGQIGFGPLSVFAIPLLAKDIADATRDRPQAADPSGPQGLALVRDIIERGRAVGLTHVSSLAELERLESEAQALTTPLPPMADPIEPFTPPLPIIVEPLGVGRTQSNIPRVNPPPVEPPDTGEEKEEEEVFHNDLLPFLTGITGIFGPGGAGGRAPIINIPGPASAPSPFVAGALPAIVRGGAQVLGGVGLGEAARGIFGGNGGTTPLSRARDANGRRPTRRQVITAARVCGIDVAAQSFNLSVTDLCTIVSKGMPRRSRGISSADMRRTRSTLRKMSTMRKTLRPLCR